MPKFMVIDDEYRLRARGYAAAATQAVSRIATSEAPDESRTVLGPLLTDCDV